MTEDLEGDGEELGLEGCETGSGGGEREEVGLVLELMRDPPVGIFECVTGGFVLAGMFFFCILALFQSLPKRTRPVPGWAKERNRRKKKIEEGLRLR